MTELPRVTVLRNTWGSAWFRCLAVAIVAGLVTHFVFPWLADICARPTVEITSPVAGERVQWTPEGQLVTGTCRKVDGDLHLYIAIHPLPTDNWYVQRMPTMINGHWAAVAFFGMEEVGLGDQYVLRAFISRETLHEGQIIELKDFPDHVAEASITVSRPATHDQR